MGTPDFALPCLEALAADPEYEVVLVMSQPDRQSGRGLRVQAPPVKKLAESLGLKMFQPESLLEAEIQEEVLSYQPDFIITAAYGLLLPQEIIQGAKIAAFNLHASLLPKYRGSAPIQRAIFAGEKKTGITSMFMIDELDGGDILLQERIEIGEYEDYGSVYARLKELAARVMLQTMEAFIQGKIRPQAQDEKMVTYAPHIERTDQEIDFNHRAEELKDQIRGLSPMPGAIVHLEGKLLKIWQVRVIDENAKKGIPGEIIKADQDGLHVACAQGVLALEKVQPAGKRAMDYDVFLRGNPIALGTLLTNKLKEN
jgi:methionyl-tRNA formyltransferase